MAKLSEQFKLRHNPDGSHDVTAPTEVLKVIISDLVNVYQDNVSGRQFLLIVKDRPDSVPDVMTNLGEMADILNFFATGLESVMDEDNLVLRVPGRCTVASIKAEDASTPESDESSG